MEESFGGLTSYREYVGRKGEFPMPTEAQSYSTWTSCLYLYVVRSLSTTCKPCTPFRRKRVRRICASNNLFYLNVIGPRLRPKKKRAIPPLLRKRQISPMEEDSPSEPDYDKMDITYIYTNSLADMVGSTKGEELGSDDPEAYVIWLSSVPSTEYSNSDYDSEEQETKR
jgi:hypothetical protein